MRILLLLTALLLAGCATTPHLQKPSNISSWHQRETELLAIRSWKLNGAVAIQTPEKAFSANLNWQQNNRKTYIINLFGPLGIGAVKLTGTPQQVLLYANQTVYSAQNPEELLEDNLGWQLPVSNLYYWIRGLPAPGIPAKPVFNQQHHLIQLTQQKWTIFYLSYQTVNNLDLPRKMILQSKLVHGVIVINSWN